MKRLKFSWIEHLKNTFMNLLKSSKNLFLGFVLLQAACFSPESKKEERNSLLLSNLDSSIYTKRILVSDSIQQNFGYEIFKSGHLYIRQASIPAITGNIFFADSIQANKVADLVLYKLKMGILPPSVSIQELDSLKIAY